MSTGAEFAFITDKKLLGFTDFDQRFLQYLRTNVRDGISRQFVQGSFDEAMPLSSSGANQVQVDLKPILLDGFAHDGAGNILNLDEIDRTATFENVAAQVYEVGARYVEYPREIRINPRTGRPEYDRYVEGIGRQATPDLVTVGVSTLTLRVDSLFEQGVGVANHTGRQVRVFRVVPGDVATSEVVAIETCTVFYGGGQNQITTTGLLGQSVADSNPNLYLVQLIGITVFKDSATNRPTQQPDETFFVGTVTGNGGTPTVFDITGQTLIHSAAAGDIDVLALGNWADGTTNPGGDLQVVLAKIISDLTSVSAGRGAAKLTAAGVNASTLAIQAKRLDQMLQNLLTIANQNAVSVGLEAVRRIKTIIAQSTAIVGTSTATASMAVDPNTGNAVLIDGSGGAIAYGKIQPGSTWNSSVFGSGFTGFNAGVIWDDVHSRFIAFGVQIQTSPTGATWTQRATGIGTAYGGAVNPSGVSVIATTSDFYRSTDGVNWSLVSGGAAFTSSFENVVVWDPVNANFVALLSNGNTLISADGLTWTAGGTHLVTGGSSISGTYFARRNAIVVCGSDGSDFNIQYSLDGGVTWQLSLTTSSQIWVVGAESCLLVGHYNADTIDVAYNIASAGDYTSVQLPAAEVFPTGVPYRGFLNYLQCLPLGIAAIAFVGNASGVYELIMGDVTQPLEFMSF